MQRRSLVSGLAAALLLPRSEVVAAPARRRTPGQILGPYYPVLKPAECDNDLTQVSGRARRAAGQIVHLRGRVLDERGDPVAADIEVWQADGRGHYAHRSDRAPGSADPDFQGYAAFRSGGDGRYRLTTIRPGAYPDDGAGGMRAPHIHFQVTGKVNRLITQMYFEGEPLNDSDRVLAFANAGRSRLIAASVRDPIDAALTADWDIVLRDG